MLRPLNNGAQRVLINNILHYSGTAKMFNAGGVDDLVSVLLLLLLVVSFSNKLYSICNSSSSIELKPQGES